MIDKKFIIEILKKEAKTVKERQVYEGAKEKLPTLKHELKYKLVAAKVASV